MVQLETIRKKFQALRKSTDKLRKVISKKPEDLTQGDKTLFNDQLKEYRNIKKALKNDLKTHVKEEATPEFSRLFNEYKDQKIFHTETKKQSYDSIAKDEKKVLDEINEGKTFSEYFGKEIMEKLKERYADIEGATFFKTGSLRGSRETKDPVEEIKKTSQSVVEEAMKQATEKIKKQQPPKKAEVKSEKTIDVSEEQKEEDEGGEGAGVGAGEEKKPVMSPDEQQAQEEALPQYQQATAPAPAPAEAETQPAPPQKAPAEAEAPPQPAPATAPAPPTMTINGQDKPMFLPETQIYQQQEGFGSIPEITQQQITKALDANNEQSRVSMEEIDRQQSNIETLKKEIDAMHLIYNDFIKEFQTAQHKKEYSEAIKSKNNDVVVIHHRKMKKTIANYYKTTDLKVGVIVSAGSLFQQYNNDLRAVLGTSSSGLVQGTQSTISNTGLKKIQKGKAEIVKPAEIRPKQAQGGYSHAMRQGISSRIPPTKTKEATNYKLTPDDMVKQYSSRRQYILPSRMYNVPDNIFVKSKK